MKEEKRLTRNMNDKVMLGVCSGFADYFNADPTLVRILFVLIGLATAVFPTLIVYIVLGIVLPERYN
ncbi:PspC domain-containing protein [Haloplasma contractile]|uniref:PspC domain family protein n=1 Tax=Haloplasma contractile SSD-17B TaxID=1033810 RepID=U2DXU9_9MOLU|nr:PspC domain-containing protein [Haloplasma contractile]ERJ13087.1 PspC domain family protein [Haloplasma contractile SSD-17B]